MNTTQDIIRNLDDNAPMTLREIITQEMNDFKGSNRRKLMLIGQEYYGLDHDILEKRRTGIGEGGRIVEVPHLANNKLVHGYVRKLVDQKVGYLLSKPFGIQADGNEAYKTALEGYLGKSFKRLLRNVGRNAINKGIGWIQVYYNDKGELSFKLIPSEEVVPLWKDAAHTELDAIIRFYEVEVYEAKNKITITKVEFWSLEGVKRYKIDPRVTGQLIPDEDVGADTSHFAVVGEGVEQPLNWEQIPFIPFKYNDLEMPLVQVVKSLVDNYDKTMSGNADNIEDLPEDIFVLKNYDGANLGEFRKNVSLYRAIKVSGDGDVDTLSLDIDTEAFKTHVGMLRKSIYEFGRGLDTQSEDFAQDKSGTAIRFSYGDLDLDANDIESEFQAGLEQLIWFIDQHLFNTTKVDYSDISVDILFNRDILINETEAVKNAKDSVGILSDETIVANHPWTTDTQAELDRKKKDQESVMDDYPSLGVTGQTSIPKVADEE
ncbi:phage portal protein [Paenibacillus sp. IHBB 10380]|uniref:phage portal protein n=1 Tax=Paenibacillus sp. IHBB 10380 TaxID=1566358 RepID=UPI000AC60428|nr:phage portal protein [Paenibacillus sp. IHBB 10380]